MGDQSTQVGPPTEAAGDFAVGDRIGKYQLLQRIGAGGYGTVWMAVEDPPLARKVAIKVLHEGCSDATRARFEREGPIIAQLSHPGIAEVYDSGVTSSGRLYQVMELVDGEELGSAMAKMDERTRLEVFVQVCEAAAYANARGIVHRDLKPGNVLVTRHGDSVHAKVIDFGIAKQLGSTPSDARGVTLRGQALGTLAYMSPEQAEGQTGEVDARCDGYALGVMLCELVTGQTPMQFPAGESLTVSLMRVARQEGYRKPSQLAKNVPADVETIVLRANAPKPEDRYANAAELARDVRAFLAGEAIAGKRDGAVASAVRAGKAWMGRNSAMTAALVTLATLGLGVAVISPLLATYTRAHMYVSSLVFPAPFAADPLEQVRIITLDDTASAEALARMAKDVTKSPELREALDDVNTNDLGTLRLLHAAMLERLAHARPASVVMDLFFVTDREREDPLLTRSMAALDGLTPKVPVIVSVKDWPEEGEEPKVARAILQTPGVRWGAVALDHLVARDFVVELAFKPTDRPAMASAFVLANAGRLRPDALAEVDVDIRETGVRVSYWQRDETLSTGRKPAGTEKLLPVDGVSVGAEGSTADWKLQVPRHMDAIKPATWSYERALGATADELAAWCAGKVIVIGDARMTRPDGLIDYVELGEDEMVAGPLLVAQMIEALSRERPTRVPTVVTGPIILLGCAGLGVGLAVWLQGKRAKLMAALAAASVGMIALAIAALRMAHFECGPLIPLVTMWTGAGLTWVVFVTMGVGNRMRFVRISTA